MRKASRFFSTTSLFLATLPILTQVHAQVTNTIRVNENSIGFAIPSFSTILSFVIKFFFVIAGIAALIYLLWGALSWVTSGGDKGNIEKARNKIVNAIVGVLLIIVVVAVVATLEQVVFKQALCFGLTCDVTLPNLLDKRGP
jgi:uncharacterized membrane protein